MFGSSYWYYDAPDGRRWNWSKEPTYQCPNRPALREVEEPTPLVDRLIPTIAMRDAAEALATTPEAMARLLENVHARISYGRQRDANGRLTDRCSCCGAKMRRLGFRAWVDEPIPENELTDDHARSMRVSERLGLDGEQRRTTWSGHFETKRAAQEWAHRESRDAKAAPRIVENAEA